MSALSVQRSVHIPSSHFTSLFLTLSYTLHVNRPYLFSSLSLCALCLAFWFLSSKQVRHYMCVKPSVCAEQSMLRFFVTFRGKLSPISFHSEFAFRTFQSNLVAKLLLWWYVLLLSFARQADNVRNLLQQLSEGIQWLGEMSNQSAAAAKTFCDTINNYVNSNSTSNSMTLLPLVRVFLCLAWCAKIQSIQHKWFLFVGTVSSKPDSYGKLYVLLLTKNCRLSSVALRIIL